MFGKKNSINMLKHQTDIRIHLTNQLVEFSEFQKLGDPATEDK